MQVHLTVTPGYRLKIARISRMSELVDRALTSLAAVGGSAAFLEILRRWLQRRQEKRQEQLQLDVRILEEGHALRQEAYQREREALQALAEERERRHKAELAALEAQMQAKVEALTRANDDLTRRLGSRGAAHGPAEPPVAFTGSPGDLPAR
jgi:thioesterase domain-containing protein